MNKRINRDKESKLDKYKGNIEIKSDLQCLTLLLTLTTINNLSLTLKRLLYHYNSILHEKKYFDLFERYLIFFLKL